MFGKYLKVATFMRKEVTKIVTNSNCENSSKETAGWGSKPHLDTKGRLSALLLQVREGTFPPTDSSGERTHLSSSECSRRAKAGVSTGHWALSLGDCTSV